MATQIYTMYLEATGEIIGHLSCAASDLDAQLEVGVRNATTGYYLPETHYLPSAGPTERPAMPITVSVSGTTILVEGLDFGASVTDQEVKLNRLNPSTLQPIGDGLVEVGTEEDLEWVSVPTGFWSVTIERFPYLPLYEVLEVE